MARTRSATALNNVARNSSNNDATLAALFKALSSVEQELVRYLLMRDCGAAAQNRSVAHIVRHRAITVCTLRAQPKAVSIVAWKPCRGLARAQQREQTLDDGMVFAQ